MQTSSSSAPPPPPPPMFSPPLQQAAKKQRATATPQTDRLSLQAENAMSWRKAELARLQQQLPPPSASSSSNNTAAAAVGVSHADLLARARQSIHKQQAPPPPPPPPQPLPHERRTSDLYPEAPKTAARSGPPNNNNNTNNSNKEGPPIPSPPNTTPATAKVVRRLDVSFASDRNDRTTATTTTTTSSTTTGSIPPPPPLPLPHTMLSPPVVVATSFASYNSPELTVELPTTNTTNEQTSSNMQVHFGNEEQEEDSRAVTEQGQDFSQYAEEEDPIPPPVQTPGPEMFLNHHQPKKKQPTPFVRAAVSMEDELEEDVNERRPSTAIPPPPPPALFQVSSNEDAPTSSRPPPPPPPPHPSSSSSSSSQPQSIEMRFIKEVQRLEQEKAQALQRVVELERSLQQQQHSFQTGSSASTTTTTTTFEFTTILQRMDEHYGDDVAWQWARQQVCAVYDQGTPLEHLESPAMNNNTTTTTTTSSGMMMNRQAMPFPRPKTSPSSNTNTSTPTIIEEEFLIEAVRSVPFEFVDEEDATTFTVRRPYGLADERELWMKAGQATSKMYMKTASGMDGSSLEVIALIHADQSILAVYENGYARHQNAKGGDWEEFGNVYERNEPLGWILYRDAQNNGEEQQYSLDQVFEGIIAVRQYYCHSVVSAADILKRKQPTRQQAKAEGAVVSPGKDVGVDTKDLLLPKESSSNNSSGGKDSKSSSSPPSDEGSDILSTAFQMFISSLVHLLWNVFVRLPLRILFNMVALATAVGILAWMWVYYEYDSGAAHIGSSVHLMFNQPGIL